MKWTAPMWMKRLLCNFWRHDWRWRGVRVDFSGRRETVYRCARCGRHTTPSRWGGTG